MSEMNQKLDKNKFSSHIKWPRCKAAVLGGFLLILPMFGLLSSRQAIASNSTEEAYSFALVGDMPYDVGIERDDPAMNRLVAQVNNDPSIKWVLHVGDIKTGASRCSDKMLSDRKRRFEQFSAPFVLTPGDNEWTDCHRLTAGRFDPLERLNALRELFFDEDPIALKQNVDWLKVQSETQGDFADFSENRMWAKQGVVFGTIHLVGSQNGQQKFSIFASVKRSDRHDEALHLRQQAAQSWLQAIFDVAEKEKSPAVFIAIHANPGLGPHASSENRAPYRKVIRKLYRESKKFPGRVVLAHGDSHTFRVDQPRFGKTRAPHNLIRVESFGDSNANWIKVSVDTNSPAIFSFAPVVNR